MTDEEYIRLWNTIYTCSEVPEGDRVYLLDFWSHLHRNYPDIPAPEAVLIEPDREKKVFDFRWAPGVLDSFPEGLYFYLMWYEDSWFIGYKFLGGREGVSVPRYKYQDATECWVVQLVVNPPETVKQRFDSLAQQWKEDTWVHSFKHTILDGSAYSELLSLGDLIIKNIIGELESGDHWIGWSWLLEEITHVDPYSLSAVVHEDGFSKGNVDMMAECWIEWYKTKYNPTKG